MEWRVRTICWCSSLSVVPRLRRKAYGSNRVHFVVSTLLNIDQASFLLKTFACLWSFYISVTNIKSAFIRPNPTMFSLAKMQQRTNLLCYISHMQAWQEKRRVFVAVFSCLEMGPTWTKTVFHCWLTGSCESIYSLTAMRQNGPWDTGASSSLHMREGSLFFPLNAVHGLHLSLLCVFVYWGHYLTVSPAPMKGCGFPFWPLINISSEMYTICVFWVIRWKYMCLCFIRAKGF